MVRTGGRLNDQDAEAARREFRRRYLLGKQVDTDEEKEADIKKEGLGDNVKFVRLRSCLARQRPPCTVMNVVTAAGR